MKTLLKALTLASILTCLAAGDVMAFGAGSGTTRDVANEAEIREIYKQFTAAWNTHEVGKISGMWAIDGDHIEPDGTVAKSREEVDVLLARQHGSVFKDTQLELNIDTVWFMRGDVALIDGTYAISGIHDLEGNAISGRGGHLTSVLIKEKNRWWIAASRLMIPSSLPYKKN